MVLKLDMCQNIYLNHLSILKEAFDNYKTYIKSPNSNFLVVLEGSKIQNTILIGDEDNDNNENDNENNEDIFETIFNEIKENFKNIDEEDKIKEEEKAKEISEKELEKEKEEKKERKKSDDMIDFVVVEKPKDIKDNNGHKSDEDDF